MKQLTLLAIDMAGGPQKGRRKGILKSQISIRKSQLTIGQPGLKIASCEF
jgi:hypothetical protein